VNGVTIGEVAEHARVHIEMLRNYERRGLVERPPRSASNYRLYPEDAVRRVRFIERAQELGFSQIRSRSPFEPPMRRAVQRSAPMRQPGRDPCCQLLAG